MSLVTVCSQSGRRVEVRRVDLRQQADEERDADREAAAEVEAANDMIWMPLDDQEGRR